MTDRSLRMRSSACFISVPTNVTAMPKVRRSKKRPPEGWEMIEPTLEELDRKMRDGKVIGIRNTTFVLEE